MPKMISKNETKIKNTASLSLNTLIMPFVVSFGDNNHIATKIYNPRVR